MALNCPPTTLYSFEAVACTINKRPVVGFWEGDDAIKVERPNDLGEVTTGADGASVVNITASETATVTLMLMPNSAMNSYLEQTVKAMRMGSQRLIEIDIRDSTTGEGGGCTSSIIIKEPEKSYGAKSNSRAWVFHCGCWRENDIIYAPVAA